LAAGEAETCAPWTKSGRVCPTPREAPSAAATSGLEAAGMSPLAFTA
jgi:hypothetical protein